MCSDIVGLTGYGSGSEEEEEEEDEEEPDSDEDLEERIRQKREAYERKIKEEGIYNEDELGICFDFTFRKNVLEYMYRMII